MRGLGISLAFIFTVAACAGGDSEPTATSVMPTTGAPPTSTTSDDSSGSSGSSSTTTAESTEASSSRSSTTDPTVTGAEDTGDTDAPTTTGVSSGLVVMETSMGTITLELFPEQAPITVDNFLAYIASGFYDGSDGLGQTIFHRVIPGFVIQGGGLTDSLGDKVTMAPIVNEHDSSGLTNDRGTLSMARTSDPNSATSQFFVNLVDNANLDEPPGYAVFAQVVEGMDIVDAIAGVPTTDVPPYSDVPIDPIYITSISLE